MTMTAAEREAAAIEGCDSEPIHTPGYIQSCGFLFGFESQSEDLAFVSSNVAEFLDNSAEDMLDASLPNCFSETLIHSIRNVQSRSTATRQRELVGEIVTKQGRLMATAHCVNDTTLVEVTGHGDIPSSFSAGLDRLRWLTRSVDKKTELEDILQSAVADLRAFSGYDRVKAYRFRPDGSGEVVAEARASDIDSFLGLRFPSFDIPAQARKLYVKTPIRMIADIDGQQVALMSKSSCGDVDMSLAILRGTMPVHCEYLRNMGVRSTLSLPIVVDGKLWGLFAFHHRTPRYLGGDISLAIEFAGQYLNMLIASAIHTQEHRSELKALHIARNLFARADEEKRTRIKWGFVKDKLQDMMPSDGAAFYSDMDWHTHGDCPEKSELSAITKHLVPVDDGISISDELLEHSALPNANQIAGALRIEVDAVSNAAFYFFRKSAQSQVMWAGSPEKIVDDQGPVLRLSPRGSFGAFAETMEGRSESWEPMDIVVARGLKRAIQRAFADAIDRDTLLESLELHVEELNHRVRNILALVKSIVRQSAESDEVYDAHFKPLEARIFALASAHNILAETAGRTLGVQTAFEREALPFPDHRIAIGGPVVDVSSEAASVFVLVIHEMFSNAAKHGALSRSNGHISISWILDEAGLHIYWREFGGPEVVAPSTHGFGQTLIENAFAYEFKGNTTVLWLREGVSIDLFVPAEVVIADNKLAPSNRAAAPIGAITSAQPLEPMNVLILEDDFIIASETKGQLDTLDDVQCFLAANNEDALNLLEQQTFGFAILDINLDGRRSFQTAERLMELGVPFVFVTGYDRVDKQTGDLALVPILTKPTRLEAVLDAMASYRAKTTNGDNA
ncbi:MAG: HWE histidine kinase domain-containing protein [Hyphomicrobiales bacterium]|jgi:light-regulated signal transduction histidine kinase (bacteriophytochrome)/CheY-like chemotaxis protein